MLHVLDRVAGLHVERDGLAGEGLDEDLRRAVGSGGVSWAAARAGRATGRAATGLAALGLADTGLAEMGPVETGLAVWAETGSVTGRLKGQVFLELQTQRHTFGDPEPRS